MPTIGVSVAVPEPWGSQLQDYRIEVGDHAARHIPTHVTLLPPVEVDEADMHAVRAHLQGIAREAAPFRMHLRGTGTFRPVSPVVFVNVVEGISECEMLAALVRRGALEVQTTFPYHPHVTIAHRVDEAALARAFEEMSDFEAAFEVTELWCYLHDETVGWQPHRSFGLGAPVQDDGVNIETV